MLPAQQARDVSDTVDAFGYQWEQANAGVEVTFPACALPVPRAPSSQESDDLPPSVARGTCEAIADHRVSVSLHAALQDASA